MIFLGTMANNVAFASDHVGNIALDEARAMMRRYHKHMSKLRTVSCLFALFALSWQAYAIVPLVARLHCLPTRKPKNHAQFSACSAVYRIFLLTVRVLDWFHVKDIIGHLPEAVDVSSAFRHFTTQCLYRLMHLF